MISSEDLVAVANAFYALLALIILAGAIIVYMNKKGRKIE
jgi:hypothetical protein